MTLIIGGLAFAVGWYGMATYDTARRWWRERRARYPDGNWDSYLP